jgi:CheY-like chemotaxis protein/tRNA A-37 threonylcarbamoyl transferase component Bud32
MKNVLVVDDNAIVRRHLKGLLERDGCVVCEAADGQQALELVETRAFDVMFLDLGMPTLDGAGVLAALGERKKVIPTVLITSSESSAEIVRAFKLGAKDYLLKPFREPQIRRAMHQATGLDYTTIQRTRSDVAVVDRDEGLAQILRTQVGDSDAVDHAEEAERVPEVVGRPHQLVLIGSLEASGGDDEDAAEALADLAAQHDPTAALVRLLPDAQAQLPEVTVFHAAALRTDQAAVKRVLRAVRSGAALTSGRLVRALHYDGPLELNHLYWWTLRHSVEAALQRLIAGGSKATLDLSLAPDDQAQLGGLVEWALEFAESRMLELSVVRDPEAKLAARPGPPSRSTTRTLPIPTPVPPPEATRVQPAVLASSLAARTRPPPPVLAPPPPLRPPTVSAGPEAPLIASPFEDEPAPVAVASAPREGPPAMRIPGFELGPLLGEGGMSRVFLATQKSLRRQVCVKVMRDEVASDPVLAQRFHDEGVALATLRHPNIVSVLDVGRTEDGQLFMVMEYVDGGDLRAFAALQERVPVGKTVELVSQLLSGLGEAHGHGIIHRDLKPSNVLLATLKDQTTLVKLVDFGIAKLLEGIHRHPGQTRHGTVVGTPGYMAPEQLLGMDVSFATDLYAVGIILFELVTGRRPFVARDEFELAQLTMMTPVPHLQAFLGPQAPEGLDHLLTSLLAKNPKDRPQSASQVRAALLAIPLPVAA